jgi:Type II secretion system (T2SS), protein E, N-terminal domain
MDTVLEDVRPARPGVTPPSQPGRLTGFLSDVIVELGYVDNATAEWAIEQGRVVGQALPTVLLESNILSEDQLSRAIAELHGLEHVDLGTFDVDLEVARLISKSAARRYEAVPVAFDDDGTLLVALSDPVDPLSVDDIAVMTKSDVHPMVASESSIDALIEQLVDAPAHPAQPEDPPAEFVPGGQPTEPADAFAPILGGPDSPGTPDAPAAPEPAPAGGDAGEMAQMRTALADLAARVESFTSAPVEPRAVQPAEPAEPSVSVEEHDGVLDRLAAAESRAEEHDDVLDRLADSRRRAEEAEASLAELRTERDRERERHARAEQALHAQLESAQDATRRLEQRLANVLTVTAEIRAACEKLVGPAPR